MEERQENSEYRRYNKGKSFTIYKGVRGKYGAFRLSPSFPVDNIPMKDRDGFVMLEMAEAKGPNRYDWENKVIFKLSLTDMSKICMFLRSPDKAHYFCEKTKASNGETYNSFQIFHDTSKASGRAGTETKNLKFSKGTSKHSVMAQMVHKRDSDTTIVSVPISPEESYIIAQLLTGSFGKILSW